MRNRRIGICLIMHESNGFSAIEAGLDHFRNVGGIRIGDEMLDVGDCQDEITAFLEVLDIEGVTPVPLIGAAGFAAGNVSADAVEYLSDALRKSFQQAGQLDGVLFALHGSMSSVDIPDIESHFLQIVRDHVGDCVPVVCTLDCHAVVTRRMVELSTAIIAYKTHPHVDVVETGRRGAEILIETLGRRVRPAMAWRKIPMIFPPPDDGSKSGVMKELFDEMIAISRRDDVLDCSLFPAQCWLDVPEQGWAVVTVTDGDELLAQCVADELAERAWSVREQLLPAPMLSADEAVRAAASAEGHPIVITDSADTAGGGAPGDTTQLLSALITGREMVDGLILIHLPDTQAAREIADAGVGSTVTVDVGGKRDTRFSTPLTVTGDVLYVGEGQIEDVGDFGSTPFVDVGRIDCLGIDNVRVVLTELVVFGPQPSVFRKVGIEPFDAKIVALKTGIGFKVTYNNAAVVFRTDCPGAGSYNLKNFDFKHIPRPMYPLDDDMDWRPSGAGE